ncbi:hypothetical protein EVAR_19064_1 [Eumeta japonica]|uniref:Uncharacterized protein n=1 Tax=Eumeta variegata TaxID=151549 RepID=A0A4C1UQF2_EUMVA|nr:hypothetical protein EVAR_19064_1 [Eumeta japonica]
MGSVSDWSYCRGGVRRPGPDRTYPQAHDLHFWKWFFEEQTSLQTTRKWVLIAKYGHSQFQRSNQCITGFSGGHRIPDEKGIDGGAVGRQEGAPELSLAGCKATAEPGASRQYPVGVWEFLGRAGTFSYRAQVDHSTAVPLTFY